MDSLLSSSVGCGGRPPIGQTERHATQDLGSACPLARRSARSNMQRACTIPPWTHGMATVCDCPPTPQQSHLEPEHSWYTMPWRLPPFPLVHACLLRLGSRPPPRPKSLITNVSASVAVDGRPTRERCHTPQVDPRQYLLEVDRAFSVPPLGAIRSSPMLRFSWRSVGERAKLSRRTYQLFSVMCSSETPHGACTCGC